MKPNSCEPAIAATLYGPCEVRTEIAGTPVQIIENTIYPYSGEVEIKINPAKKIAFCLWLRNPEWSSKTKIVCPGADICQVGAFWQVRKSWKAGDVILIRFDQSIHEVPAINGEVALQYGPLLYVLPLKSDVKIIKTYDKPEFKDYFVNLVQGTDTAYSLPGNKRTYGFGFVPKVVSGTNPDFPLDNPIMILEGAIYNKDGTLKPVTLVPMGSKEAQLRRATFPITTY